MEGATVITAIIAGVLLAAVIGLTIEFLNVRREADYWRGLHHSLLGLNNELSMHLKTLLKYRHVKEIIANIERGSARKK